MPIVSQSASLSYCPFPLLSAPRIAGLLPATTGSHQSRPPDPPPFTFSDPRIADLLPAERDRLYSAARTLLDVALGHIDGTLSDHALNTALALFRRAVTGQPMKPTNPAQFNAEKDVILMEWAIERTRRAESHGKSHYE